MIWLWTIGIGVATGLITTAIITLFRKRRLYVVVSSLFRHSSLTDEGTIVQLSLINRGIKTEEDIEITLDRQLTYELIAATVSRAKLEGDMLMVPRLPANDQIQFVLLVDGGTFSPASILASDSRETKGTTIESLEKVPLGAGPTLGLIGILLSVVAVAAAFGFFGRGLVNELQETQDSIDKANATIAQLEISEEEAARITELENEGWRGVKRFVNSELAAFYPNRLPVSVENVARDGDYVIVEVEMVNLTDDLARFSGAIISPAGDEDRTRLMERQFWNKVLVPDASLEVSLKVYLPPDYPQQLLIGDFSIQAGDDSGNFEKHIQAPE